MEFRSWFATCPRGAEQALGTELAAAGAKGIRPGSGGVRFTGRRETALRACLTLRTALRLLEPLGDFDCPNAEALYAGVRALPWPDRIEVTQTFAVTATGVTPELSHTHFTALKIKDAIVDSIRDAKGSRPDINTERPDVLVVAHLGKGRCSISLDLAGDLLSNRGYRVQTVEAPLREALAAAILIYSGWDLQRPLLDPTCGSGTIAIEAALLAADRAPNAKRPLACENWTVTSEADRQSLRQLREELETRAHARSQQGIPQIVASDRDADAVNATKACVRAAGLEDLIRVEQRDAREMLPLSPPGQIVSNPPYGERLDLGGRKQLKSFFHAFGSSLRRLQGHRAAILAGSEDFESAFGMRPRARRELWNGPLACILYSYEVWGAPIG